MDVKYINPFLNSFTNVMPILGITDIKKGNVSVKSKVIESKGVVIILGIVGSLRGNVIYVTTMECAKSIASSMMMGMPVTEFDELAQSAISELTNMLTANASIGFADIGVNIDISTPTLIYGSFSATASIESVICIELLINGLPFEVNISLENI